jgi:glycosyltransferase involved in cell wall biosynthesis
MKILISAYACRPNLGSEPGIGWGVMCQTALRHPVWVLTAEHNQPSISAEMANRRLPMVRFVYVRQLDSPILLRPCWSGYLLYVWWQLRAFWAARRLHKEIGFDLVHHVTYGNAWAPSFMGWLGIPFLWSAGACDVTPWRFYRTLSWRGRFTEALRTVAVKLAGVLTRASTASYASVILTSSDTGLWKAGARVKEFPIGGLPQREREELGRLPVRDRGPSRFASIGRLEGWKGFSLGLAAFAAVHREIPDAEYWIIGDGPERRRLENMAERLGCADKVRFLMWMPRGELLKALAEVDVLVHPSLHEQFGYVVVEAMAAGRPVICLNVAGPGKIVSNRGGVAIPATDPGQVVSDLSRHMLRMAQDPACRLAASRNAREWAAEHWSWDRVGKRLAAVYRDVLHSSSRQVGIESQYRTWHCYNPPSPDATSLPRQPRCRPQRGSPPHAVSPSR